MDIIEILGKITMTEWIIRLIGAGLIVGSLFAFLGIRRRSKIVSGFLSAGALSRGEAKTLTEAGLKNSFFNRFSLRDGTVLSRYVVKTGVAGEEDGEAAEKGVKKGGSGARYYMPEEKKEEAEVRLVKKAPIYIWIVGALALAAATEAAVRIVPMFTSRM